MFTGAKGGGHKGPALMNSILKFWKENLL